jgi:uncharacterized protein (DUF1786 family)
LKQILAIDVGTGTQDIFLLRVGLSPENGFKLVMPSPTMRIRERILDATRRREPLLLTGVTMGGGPCHWAAEAHLKAGYPIYATPKAAQTFNDDLIWVQKEMGVQIVSEDEAARMKGCQHIEMQDLDLDGLRSAFLAFGFELQPDVLAVAVFDHGASPPGISDRKFRFDLIARQLEESNHLTTFAYTTDAIPPEFTRLLSVRQVALTLDCPMVFMDTAPAAVLGTTLDPVAESLEWKLITNIGNYHTLAVRLGPDGVEGIFEHHTGLLERQTLEHLLQELAAGTISGDLVFADNGHGALLLDRKKIDLPNDEPGVIVTGPRRAMIQGSIIKHHFAAPLGDMMLTGCFGLLLAIAEHLPQWRGVILDTLAGQKAHTAPWDLASSI